MQKHNPYIEFAKYYQIKMRSLFTDELPGENVELDKHIFALYTELLNGNLPGNDTFNSILLSSIRIKIGDGLIQELQNSYIEMKNEQKKQFDNCKTVKELENTFIRWKKNESKKYRVMYSQILNEMREKRAYKINIESSSFKDSLVLIVPILVMGGFTKIITTSGIFGFNPDWFYRVSDYISNSVSTLFMAGICWIFGIAFGIFNAFERSRLSKGEKKIYIKTQYFENILIGIVCIVTIVRIIMQKSIIEFLKIQPMLIVPFFGFFGIAIIKRYFRDWKRISLPILWLLMFLSTVVSISAFNADSIIKGKKNAFIMRNNGEEIEEALLIDRNESDIIYWDKNKKVAVIVKSDEYIIILNKK